MTKTEHTMAHRATDTIRTVLGVGGLVSVIVGVLILVNPVKSGAVMMQILAVIMALYALVVGVIYLSSAIFTKTLGGWARTGNVLLGILFILGGIVLMSNLATSGEVLVIFLSVTIGILWIFEGALAFSAANQGGNKVWSILFGIISIIAGGVLIFSPFAGAFTLWILLGISLLVMGAVQIVRAFSIKVPQV